MKRIVVLILVLAMTLSLCACGGPSDGGESTAASTGSTASGTVKIGYSKELIVPEETVPLAGSATERISSGMIDYLYGTCVAVEDEEGNRFLIFSIDLQNAYGPATAFRSDISIATGISTSNITLSFTHTHSAPKFDDSTSPSITNYNALVTKALIKAAKDALEDLSPAKMYTAKVETEGLNFVRRYEMNDGTYCGDNFGDTSSGYKGHESEADHTLQLIKFVRDEGKSVIMANFQMHSNFTISGTAISSDVAGAFRDSLEELSDCNVIYLNGASGNINPKSRIADENKYTDHRSWGKALAEYAMSKEDEYVEVSTGSIRTTKQALTVDANHEYDDLAEKAQEIVAHYEQTKSLSECTEMGKPFGITSYYAATSIISNAAYGPSRKVEMIALAIGDVSFIFAPVELFDALGMYIKDHSPYDMTFICGYTNQCQGYMPSDIGYEHGGYEVQTCGFGRGSGEIVAQKYVEMLNELYSAE